MDYLTKPTSRDDLRRLSRVLRQLFNCPPTGPFPVLEALERIGDVFEGSNYIILEDNKLPSKTMAQCYQNDQGGFTIEIKESVYTGAYEKKVGAFLGFICHEICHVFLFKIGFTPICTRSFENDEIPKYRSVEWQAKALCGETMIPFEESAQMSKHQIMDRYHVSKAFAEVRLNQKHPQKH